MINLKETTFIIPIGIESEDRATNAEITLNYLCKHLSTNIIIYEYSSTSRMENILSRVNKGETSIKHIFEKSTSEIFHRTKFLNIMLNMSETPVVVNYDVDIILEPSVYKKCTDKILNGKDLVYPYFWGDSQRRIFYPGREKIKNTLDLSSLIASDFDIVRSEYGHCQFFKRDSYIKGGMENEEFISYGPEDQERGYRFKFLGYNVEWSDDLVYHIEHTRGINSSSSNPYISSNHKLFEKIKGLSKDQLIQYYLTIPYLEKYKR